MSMRAFQIGWRLARLVVVLRRTRHHQRQRGADSLRDTLGGLGTTFVKLGQGLSLRRDLIPGPYLEALESLQSEVPPFPGAVARDLVEAAFGRPVTEVFESFDETPLAAASIAQVHRARHSEHGELIVKVRRPRVRALIEHDIRWLKRLIRLASWLLPALARVRPLALVEELSLQLHQEIDFNVEARNARRLGDACRAVPDLSIPAIIPGMVFDEVLVQGFSAGKPVRTAFGSEDGKHLAQVLLDAYLHQLFVVGFFHGDPHPGNLFIMADGRLCMHDFGLVGFLDSRSRRALALYLVALAQRDAEAALDAAMELGLLRADLERRQYLVEIDKILSELAGMPLKEWSIAQALWRVARIGGGKNFALPRNLLVLFRALFLIESTTRALSPEFDLVSELAGRHQVLERGAASAGLTPRLAMRTAREIPTLLGQWLKQAQRDDGRPSVAIHLRGIEALEATIAHTGNRIALALVTLGLYVAGSLLMLHSAGPRVLGDLPVSALIAYSLALALSWRLIRAIVRSGRL